jgi:hypothetical protein
MSKKKQGQNKSEKEVEKQRAIKKQIEKGEHGQNALGLVGVTNLYPIRFG